MRAVGWLWCVLVAVFLLGCTRPRTEIVVTVRSELAAGEIQSLVVGVRRGGADGEVRRDAAQPLGDAPTQWRLPLTFVLYPSEPGDSTPVWIEALGCGTRERCTAASALVAQRAVVTYRSEETVALDLWLASNCRGAQCQPDQRCARETGRCEEATQANNDLVPLGGADASTPDVSKVDSVVVPDVTTKDDGAVCAAPQSDCGGRCVDLMTDNAACGACGVACSESESCRAGVCAPRCGSGQSMCSGACRDLSTDARNCGACGVVCAAGRPCVSGVCARPCDAGYADCDGDLGNGCEAALAIDGANCGRCGARCPSGTTCQKGACVNACASDLTFCADRCVRLTSDGLNCGACGFACATGEVCSAGVCTVICSGGTADCAGVCRDLATDRNHCGMCGNVCASGRACVAGSCVEICAVGMTTCSGVCRDLSTDAANCGACGNHCATSYMCSGGACAVTCDTGTTNCSGACRNLMSDNNNCGACGAYCAAGRSCVAGVCQLTCATGLSVCGAACVNLTTDPANCGRCGNACRVGYVCGDGTCRAPNDRRTGAASIDLSVAAAMYSADTTDAINDTSGACGCTSGADLFYRFTLTTSEIVYADTFGSSYDTSVFLQDMSGSNVTSTGLTGGVTCNDNSSCAGSAEARNAQIYALLPPGAYFLVLSGCGRGLANLQFQHLPVGNGPVVRLPMLSGTYTLTGTTSGTGLLRTTCTAGVGPENTYWTVTCPDFTATSFGAETCDASSTWDTVLEQRSGTRAPICNDDVCGVRSRIQGNLPPGPGLHALYVDGYSATSGGAYSLALRFGNCSSGLTACGVACADTQTNHDHCGACNVGCGAATCAGGRCVCPTGRDLCYGMCVDLQSNPSYCGSCTGYCGSSGVCTAGRCVCSTGYTLCGSSGCVDLQSNASHCGACGTYCARGVCTAGRCVCSAGDTLCGSQGCVDTQHDPANCGACGNVCPGSQVCAAGRCLAACPSGQTACNRTCFDLTSDATNCGACAVRCATSHGTPSCMAGACRVGACNAGWGDCNGDPADGCETSLRSFSHCGTCTRACVAGQGCNRMGACVAAGSAGTCGAADDFVACPSTGVHCPAFSTCSADSSACLSQSGYVPVHCTTGIPCSASCPGGSYWMTPI